MCISLQRRLTYMYRASLGGIGVIFVCLLNRANYSLSIKERSLLLLLLLLLPGANLIRKHVDISKPA
ncbi:hypothetical protein VTP01DRAFT_2859 [Rhizomucor pusillus]|uniref:uncharacterized protein n=1 Tax=Rhizomucor pusillus TaxID=4840 RepID=UPI003744AA5A